MSTTMDPLLTVVDSDGNETETELAITDIASARFALKTASDAYFGKYYTIAEVEKQLARSKAENKARGILLVEPYVKKKFDWVTHQELPLTEIPDPLPATVPQAVRDALAMFDEQLEIERERGYADIQSECDAMDEVVERLQKQVAAWFKTQIGNVWLAGKNYVTLSGVTMTLENDEVKFEYAELSYD